MKIRSGFVSNSSSSSFIVRFPKDPTNKETLAEMMGDCAPLCGYGAPLTSEDVVNHVHRDIERTAEDTKDFETWWSQNYWGCDYQEMFDNHKGMQAAYDGRMWWDLTEDETKLINKMFAKQEYDAKLAARSGNSAVFIYEFEYSDECGDVGCAMEHGDIFRNIDHDVESHH